LLEAVTNRKVIIGAYNKCYIIEHGRDHDDYKRYECYEIGSLPFLTGRRMSDYILKWEKLYHCLVETFAVVAYPLSSLLLTYEELIQISANYTAEQIRKDGILNITSTRAADDLALRPFRDGYRLTRSVALCMLACPSELVRPKCMDLLRGIVMGHTEFLLFHDKVLHV
jgi:hypothetical protein